MEAAAGAEGGERGGRPGGGGIVGDPATTGLSWSGRAGLAHAPPNPQVGREAATSALGEEDWAHEERVWTRSVGKGGGSRGKKGREVVRRGNLDFWGTEGQMVGSDAVRTSPAELVGLAARGGTSWGKESRVGTGLCPERGLV